MRPPPVVLSVAGSDSSCGAGAQADLKTFGAHGCHGLTAITCVVSEVPGKVEDLQPIRPLLVASQVAILRRTFPVAAAKTGMLYSAAIVNAVAGELEKLRCPVVVDPVMVASSGDPLLAPGAVKACTERLFPHATLVTPNLDELSLLVGRPIRHLREMEEAGWALADAFGCAFLLKGGHLGGRTATDLLVQEGTITRFDAPFVTGVSTHGTGCTYSAAIAANLAWGKPLVESVGRAKDFITAAIRHSFRWKTIQALNQIAPAPAPAAPRRQETGSR
jgi:hydroxymethylpyrimidine/phosphomethylpyrimidine kinase